MKITADEAREYLLHPTQQVYGLTPEKLPEFGVEYYADGPLCGMFHASHWPGVWQFHIGAKPEGWGHLVAPARRILRTFWDEQNPVRVTAWIEERNRLTLALARRVGFRIDGKLPLPGGAIIMNGWTIWDSEQH